MFNGFFLTQVFRKAYQIAEVLVAMHQNGYMESIADLSCYPCGSTTVAELTEKAQKMELDLSTWIQSVEAIREKYYHLNSFTMKQLLQLRQELYHPKELDNQVVFLLKALLPCASESVIARAIQATWEELFDSPAVVPGIVECSHQESSKDSEKDDTFSRSVNQSLDLEQLLESSVLTQSERSAYTNMTEFQGTDPLLTLLLILRTGDKENCTISRMIKEYEKMLLIGPNLPIVQVIQEINGLLAARSSSFLLKDEEDNSKGGHTEPETTSTSAHDEACTLAHSSSIDLSLSRYIFVLLPRNCHSNFIGHLPYITVEDICLWSNLESFSSRQ